MNENSKVTMLPSSPEKSVSESPTEEYTLFGGDKIQTKREAMQIYINTNVCSSPVSSSRQKGNEFKVNESSYDSTLSSHWLKLEIWALSCEHFATEGETSQIVDDIKQILHMCSPDKIVPNQTILSLIKKCNSRDINLSKTKRWPSSKEISLYVSVGFQLSCLYAAGGNLQEAESYANKALKFFPTSARNKYSYLNLMAKYPDLYARLKFNKIIISFKSMFKVNPKCLLDYIMCPSLKCDTVLTRKLFAQTEKKSLVMKTPPKVPKVVVTKHSDDQIFKAPRKREVLPSYVKKDLESYEKSNPCTNKLFDSSDDSLALNCTKTPAPTKSKRMISSLKNCPAFTRPIHSSSDVWASLSTPKSSAKKPSIRKKSQSVQGKTASENLKKRKTRSKNSHSNQTSVSPFKSRSSAAEGNKGDADCPVRRGSIEYNRCASNAMLLPEISVDDVFCADVDELSEQLNTLAVTDRETCLDIPAEMRQTLLDDLEDLRKLVERICPYPLYVDICRLLAVLKLLDSNKEKTTSKKNISDIAYLLSETMSSALRQVFLGNAMYRKRDEEEKGPYFTSLVKSCEFNSSQMEYLLSTIPSDYTVVQISLVPTEDIKLSPAAKLKTSKFIICRYQSGCSPQVMCLENSSMEKFTTSLLEEFENILKQNDFVVKNIVDDKAEWWKTRTHLNLQLKHLLKNIEDSWLGCWKGLLLSKPVSDQRRNDIQTIVNDLSNLSSAKVDEELLHILLDSSPHLSRDQLTSAVCHLWSCTPLDDVHARVFRTIRDASSSLAPTERHPLVLLLDKHIQSLPWECLPILSGVPSSRMPSLAVLSAKCASQRQCAVDTQKAFYVLNPGGDLKYSEEFFRPRFEQIKKWKGIVGIPPNPEQCTSAFVDYDLFVYCGHGSGKQYLEGVCLDRVKCRASMVVMGCSSGVLKQQSRQIEAYGVPLMYLMNECPCFVGNLWDVTDRDIDRFTDKLFDLFVPAYSTEQSTSTDIATAVSRARSVCKMPYLVGAAPVVYGLPMYAKS